jgi:hypothetical protein
MHPMKLGIADSESNKTNRRENDGAVRLIDFQPQRSGTLRGFATIRFAEFYAAAIAGISIHVQGDRAWASPPGRAWIENGQLVRDGNGKPKYSTVFSFDSYAERVRWSNAVIQLMRAEHPALFDEPANLFADDGEP